MMKIYSYHYGHGNNMQFGAAKYPLKRTAVIYFNMKYMKPRKTKGNLSSLDCSSLHNYMRLISKMCLPHILEEKIKRKVATVNLESVNTQIMQSMIIMSSRRLVQMGDQLDRNYKKIQDGRIYDNKRKQKRNEDERENLFMVVCNQAVYLILRLIF
ncbi:uncharacterized protein LOC130623800 [Hydractinia symbiolongicarpus]|uniref:uncharacterized protein LOC130623800 n=1 Tax=Hydractinia symbiolongicarpus TaxID=13093 RepID=UPI00254EDEA0|nr:uncharacterized protein LOC130623800 [Hydractinia symbiolongicarpus]